MLFMLQMRVRARSARVLFFFFFGIHYRAPRGAVPHVALLDKFTCCSVYVCTRVLARVLVEQVSYPFEIS